jgi:hypothetical protein
MTVFLLLTMSSSCLAGLLIGAKYPATITSGRDQMLSTVCNAASDLYSKLKQFTEEITAPEAKDN